MNRSVYAAVASRSEGHCENPDCGVFFGIGRAPHLDHMFGRKEVESPSTCWMLCHPCDYLKTVNSPDAATWLRRFLVFAEKQGLRAGYALAMKRLQWVEDKKAAGAA